MNLAESHIDILAPAGCYASLQTAIEAGADSVYFGLAQLNMRALPTLLPLGGSPGDYESLQGCQHPRLSHAEYAPL